MADATNPRDFLQTNVSIDNATWTEITVANNCLFVTVRQLPSETQEIIKVKHRSDGAEPEEEIPAGAVFQKGRDGYRQGRQFEMEVGDTIGFFQSTTASATLQVKEITA